MENKKGRKPYPVEMRCVTTSLRLRPDRLAKYKELGGVQWLNMVLDDFINPFDIEKFKEFLNDPETKKTLMQGIVK